jgi:hypothetical protein
MQRVDVELTDKEIITRKSDPLQFRLSIHGSLPTPHHQLRAPIMQSHELSKNNMEVYYLFDPDEICIHVLAPFTEEIPLVNLLVEKPLSV